MIIFIGRLSVALGVIVSLITVSTGIGSKTAIRERTADFSGHITIKSKHSNNSYNSSVINKEGLQLQKIKDLPEVAHLQSYATVSGIFRTKNNFAGIVYKGVGKDFDSLRFKKFIIQGTTPKITEDGYNSQVTISEKIAKELNLKLKDSIVTVFSKADQIPIYRKFEIVGIYKTDIKPIDDSFIIGDINQVRKILDMQPDQVGGIDVFLKNINNINSIYPEIEKLAGYKNYVEKATDQYPEILDWITIFDTNIALIISLMMIVVVINIIMVLLILIIERTNSIGLLKTMGASNRQIRTIFINYTLLIMIPGLLIGNFIGLSFLFLQKYFGFIKLNPENYYVSVVPVDLNPIHIMAISIGILLVSAFALILPSYLISKISPVKAVKYE